MKAVQVQPLPPLPTSRQLAWHRLERYVFVHFGPNTFTGQEWGSGRERADVFYPAKLDCRQWCRTFKEAGFKAVIITAKHHDGFCLWPSKLSSHTVGHGRLGRDVLKELSTACREYGLKFGVYLSPWDRNHPDYGSPRYNEVFKAMLREVLTSYGPVFEVWFDGANGEGPNGRRQVYDWPGFIEVVRRHQPNAVIFSDAGPDVRWVGNEQGFAGETNWNMIDRDRFVIGSSDTGALNRGDETGPDWVPAECDVSIRPGWFWRASEDSQVKSVADLMAIWYGSVGRGANLLLNVPPNSDGLISDVDARRLREFDRALRERESRKIKGVKIRAEGTTGALFDGKPETYWAAPATGEVRLTFDLNQDAAEVDLSEPISMGQRVRSFEIRGEDGGVLARGTTIGTRRIVRLRHSSRTLTVRITDAREQVALSEIKFYSAAPAVAK